jgi:HAMP domain-containing protein
MRHLSIKLKLILAVVFCLGAIALVNGALARRTYEQDLQFAADEAVRTAGKAFASMERREVDKLSAAVDALISDKALAAAFAQRDRDRLYEAAAPIFRELRERHGVTNWVFIDPARLSFLRVQRPELHDDFVRRATLDAAIRTGDTASGKELGNTVFALRVVRPFVSGGKLLGYLELGEEIDTFLSRMKAETGDDYGLVVEKKFLDERAWAATRGARRNNWGDDPETVLADATDAEAPIVGASAGLRSVPDGGRYLAPVERGGRLFVRGVVPVLDGTGRKVGGVFVLRDVTALRDRMLASQRGSALAVALVAVAMLALLLVMFELLVFRRLVKMTEAMQDVSTRLAGGDYEVGGTVQCSASDEIGRFESFLGSFLTTIGATLRELEKRRRRAG